MTIRHSLFIFLFVFALSSCFDKEKERKSDKASCLLKLSKSKVVEGDTINLSVVGKGVELSSYSLLLDGEPIDSDQLIIAGMSMGKHRVDALSTLNDGSTCKKYNFFEVLSNVQPVEKKYTIISTFDHDDSSYTQGLEYDDGLIYEGTGQYGFSYLHRFSLLDGKSTDKVDLGENYFGEGITIFKDKIYQLTYREQIGFVYDMATLEKIGEFSYAGQGWGLTHNDEHIIMSNGSNKITFRNPEDFSEVRSVEVYDNKGKIENLNELELVGDKLYANIYQTEDIVVIDPISGAVLERIDCSGLRQKMTVKSKIDVFNGIAYNHHAESFYVTGKFWPNLFEVVFE